MFLQFISDALSDFVDYVRAHLIVDPLQILPALALVISWPMFQVLFDNRAESFMCAFLLAMATRLALRFDILVLRLGNSASPRMVAILVLLAGPGLMSVLIFLGDPIWCQRFLSAYFLIMAALHCMDMVGSTHTMIKVNFPSLVLPRATRVMSQVMVIYYMGMALLNETLIAQVDPSVWLLYFGLLPILSRMVLRSLQDSVRRGIQGIA